MGQHHSSAAVSLQAEIVEGLTIVEGVRCFEKKLRWVHAFLFEEIQILVPFVANNL
jgi:hypothetical protein